MTDARKRLCMYGVGRRPDLAPPATAVLLVEEECPHPEVQDPPGTAAKVDMCGACLLGIAERKEPIKGGTWGPIRTLAETLRR